MNLFEDLHIPTGITSVIGSGGKTSMLAHLAGKAPGTVALVTTTHMFPLADRPLVTTGDEQAIIEARDRERVVSIGSVSKQGKIAQPELPLACIGELFDFVFVEADGSKQLPLKAHAEWEPVVPAESGRTILVVGAVGFGRRIDEAAHRPELFCERASCFPHDLATPALVARVIEAERNLSIIDPDAIVINTSMHGSGAKAPSDLASCFPINDIPIVTCQLERPPQEPLP